MPLNKKGLQDGLVNLAEARRRIETRVRAAEMRMAEAEAELLDLRTLLGAADMTADHYRTLLRSMEEAEKRGGGS
jgi:predicted  nucleic acid-binding Zn-ribbon protein